MRKNEKSDIDGTEIKMDSTVRCMHVVSAFNSDLTPAPIFEALGGSHDVSSNASRNNALEIRLKFCVAYRS
jgi:hypothetical protein